MSTITLPASAAELLRNCTHPAALHDASGKLVGYFEPPPRIYKPGEIPDFDEAELDRRQKAGPGIPSAEVRRILESLR
jgi:hypothetical protein